MQAPGGGRGERGEEREEECGLVERRRLGVLEGEEETRGREKKKTKKGVIHLLPGSGNVVRVRLFNARVRV